MEPVTLAVVSLAVLMLLLSFGVPIVFCFSGALAFMSIVGGVTMKGMMMWGLQQILSQMCIRDRRGGPDERGRGEEFDEKKKHPASLIRWAFVGTICMTAYSLKSALSNGFLFGSVFGLLECVVITPRYKK